MACTSGCRTQDHPSYAACLKAKSVRIPAISVDELSEQKKADVILDGYAQARSHGIQPSSTRAQDVETAVRISEEMGEAYKA